MSGPRRAHVTAPDDDATAPGAAPAHRRPAVLAAAVVGVLVLAGAGWALAARGDGPAPGAAPSATAAPTASASVVPSAAPTPSDPAVAAPAADPAATGAAAAPGGDAAGGDAPPTSYVPVTEPAVALDAPAAFATGVTARLATLEPVQGEARGPGEVAGPAVRVTVELTNATAAPVELDATVVNVYAGAELVPGEPLSGPGAAALGGTLAPGATAAGTYVFAVRPDLRDRLQVTVGYDPTVTTVLFEGAGPTA